MAPKIFGGPYKLFQTSTADPSKYSSVLSLAIMDDWSISTQEFNNGVLKLEKFQQCQSLKDVIEKTIIRLEHLMQHEKYNPKEPLDLTSL